MSARSFDINLTRKQGNIQVFKDHSSLVVRLHGHAVFIIEGMGQNAIITLSSCGWLTTTTKTAINRALTLVNSPYRIAQVKHNWIVLRNGVQVSDFHDNMTLLND
jgi:hypothetical protein